LAPEARSENPPVWRNSSSILNRSISSKDRSYTPTTGRFTMQDLAQCPSFEYFSNQSCCIFQYITDSIRLIPLCILLLLHWLCPDKSFLENTTLGVSHYETYRSCLRRRPRPHRCSCFHPDLLRLHPEQGHDRQGQHAADPNVRS
jgi:hypothetical protein